MQPLFKNKSTLSTNTYIHLVEFHQLKNNWKYWLYTATISLLFIVCTAFQIAANNYFVCFLLLICFIAFLLYRFIEPYHKTKKELGSDKVQNTLVNYYFFYEKYFRIKNNIGSSKLRYYKLYKVYENDDSFYLYLNKNNAFILEKNGFIIGDEKSFKSFIKNKVKFRFKAK